MNRLTFFVANLLGAAVVLWMGASFLGGHPMALGVTALIGVAYGIGIVELASYRRATASLARALSALPAAAGEEPEEADPLPAWLGRLHPSLRHAVRLRIEGERVGLPTPVFTPYLVGLLVMLGLLGTFFGMVETLSGAVTALQGSTELAAIRAGLAAPIAGLGVAFGTSVAGVAASAMLGLAATLCRRERVLVTRSLDDAARQPCFARYAPDQQRQRTLHAVQTQSEALPAIVARLDQLADKLTRMGGELGDALVANQAHFHEAAGSQYRELAENVGAALQSSLGESGRLAADSLQAPVSALMNTLAEQGERSQARLLELAESQGAALARQLQEATAAMQASVSETAQAQLGGSAEAVSQLAETLTRGARDLIEAHHAQLQALSEDHALQLRELNETGRAQSEELGEARRQQAEELAAARAEQTRELLEARDAQTRELLEARDMQTRELVEARRAQAEELAAVLQAQAQGLTEAHRLQAEELGAAHRAHSAQLVEEVGRLLQGGEELLNARRASEQQWLGAYEQRMDTLAQAVAAQFEALRSAEEQRATAAVERLGALEAAVAQHLATLGRELEAPMAHLIETASETPRAAAEVISQLREELSNGIERDNQLLEERQLVLEQLQSLLETVELSSEAQRKAVASMVEDTAFALQEVSARFGDRVDSGVERMANLAGDVAASATDVAALAEAFQAAVQQFGESNQALIGSLDRIEQAMDQAGARSDEQLGYYVAQAREIIDHSVLSQKEIIEYLRQLGRQEELFEAEAG
jgi:hypothetical protein